MFVKWILGLIYLIVVSIQPIGNLRVEYVGVVILGAEDVKAWSKLRSIVGWKFIDV